MRGAPCRDIDLYEARVNAARGPSRPLSSTLRIRSKIISFSEIIARRTNRTPLTTYNLPSSHRFRHAPLFKKRCFLDRNWTVRTSPLKISLVQRPVGREGIGRLSSMTGSWREPFERLGRPSGLSERKVKRIEQSRAERFREHVERNKR